MLSRISVLSLVLHTPISSVFAAPVADYDYNDYIDAAPAADHAWDLKKLTTLVAFGDSYTDESRLGYFVSHNGDAPPVGWVDPPAENYFIDGTPWARLVVQNASANLYNYAVSGASCSNEITPRGFYAGDWPSVKDYEVPAFIADSKYYEANGTKFETLPQKETVYAMWIGTNDLGNGCLITDNQVPGTTLVNIVGCVFQQLAKLYNNGARYFVLMNLIPLNLTPQYGLPGQGGLSSTEYWPQKVNYNITEISEKMLEYVTSANEMYRLRLPFEVEVQKRFPGAQFALYDVHQVINDIYNHPRKFLTGPPPLNVTGFWKDCLQNTTNCPPGVTQDSFLWNDELHPSPRAEAIVAQNFLDVIAGKSKYATYWS